LPGEPDAVSVGAGGEVSHLAVALEIVDTGRPPDDMQGIAAANVHHRHVPAEPGDEVVAEVDGLGAVGATIAP
jgi:hypothetical protein